MLPYFWELGLIQSMFWNSQRNVYECIVNINLDSPHARVKYLQILFSLNLLRWISDTILRYTGVICNLSALIWGSKLIRVAYESRPPLLCRFSQERHIRFHNMVLGIDLAAVSTRRGGIQCHFIRSRWTGFEVKFWLLFYTMRDRTMLSFNVRSNLLAVSCFVVVIRHCLSFPLESS
jgi:hypothetical protein